MEMPSFSACSSRIGAGARGAHLVHHEVHDGAVGQADELGVLAADLENGVHLGVDGRGGSGLGGDFVPHHVGADEIPGEIAPRTGGGRAHDLDAVVKPGAHPAQALGDGLERPARGHEVFPGQHPHLGVDDHHVGADGTHVDAQVAFHHRAVRRQVDHLVVLRTQGLGRVKPRQAPGLVLVLQQVFFQRVQVQVEINRRVLPGHQHRAHGPQGAEVRRNDEPGLVQAEDLPEGLAHPQVVSHAALKGYRRGEGLALGDVAF